VVTTVVVLQFKKLPINDKDLGASKLKPRNLAIT